MKTKTSGQTTAPHVCKWRELPGFKKHTDGTVVYCVIDAADAAARRAREGKPPARAPETNHCEILTPRAAREFRRQIAMGIEPHFDSEGLVSVALQQRSGPSRADRKRNYARGNA